MLNSNNTFFREISQCGDSIPLLDCKFKDRNNKYLDTAMKILILQANIQGYIMIRYHIILTWSKYGPGK